MLADAVLEGGGVKGVGLVGAIYEAERRGYKWNRVAGTSAGSIIASLLAAGYTANELKIEIMNLQFSQFLKKRAKYCSIPFELVNLWYKYGIYSSEKLEDWISERLLAKGIRTFSDLKKPLYIIASDITSGEMLILPDGIAKFGINPGSFSVAKAVVMSCSIPYFFEPVKLKLNNKDKKEFHYIVDGGLLSNYPVWLFDSNEQPKIPTFGFRLVSKNTEKSKEIKNPISLSFALVSTMLEAHDRMHISKEHFVRTILVPTLGVKATDFNLSKEDSKKLFQSGVQAANKFFEQWSFHKYVANYRWNKKTI